MALTPQDRETLLKLARETIASQARGQRMPKVDLDAVSDDLRRDAACFVTLTERGQLRGCIGSLEAHQPLVLDVRDNAIGAAFRDPRFPPVNARELEDLHIEISVLSRPEPLSYDGPDDLIAKLRPDVDGVVIERGWNRATFLPQVWEKIPDPREFLQHLCLKAYLPADAYCRPGLDVSTYQVEMFEEEG
jgi:AmmeMemoRadiSam system protein A